MVVVGLPLPVSCFLLIMVQDLPLFQMPKWFGRLADLILDSALLPSVEGLESNIFSLFFFACCLGVAGGDF